MPAQDRRALKYHTIAIDIRDRIARGELKPGQQLPASAVLAKEYRVALMTVRQALSVLEREGILEARHGAGTFVIDAAHRAKGRARDAILVVEDERDLNDTISLALRKAGYVVHSALTGAQALECLASSAQFDAVVLDLRLPDMNGLQVVEYIQQHRPAVQLLVASGYVEQDDVLRSAERRPLMMLRKPYSVKELLDRLQALLSQAVRGPA